MENSRVMENRLRAKGHRLLNTKNLLRELASASLQTGRLVRSPYPGGPIRSIKLAWAELPVACGERREIERLSAQAWRDAGDAIFDGELMAAYEMTQEAALLRLTCCSVRYRTYLAAERLIHELPEVPVPLAVGVHALIVSGDEALTLVLDDGKFSVPGGAVDAADFSRRSEVGGEPHALESAILREIREEAGLDLGSSPIDVTGVYVGARPVHMAVMVLIRCPSLAEMLAQHSGRWRPDPGEHIQALRLTPLAELVARPRALSLAARTAVGSMLHWGAGAKRSSAAEAMEDGRIEAPDL